MLFLKHLHFYQNQMMNVRSHSFIFLLFVLDRVIFEHLKLLTFIFFPRQPFLLTFLKPFFLFISSLFPIYFSDHIGPELFVHSFQLLKVHIILILNFKLDFELELDFAYVPSQLF